MFHYGLRYYVGKISNQVNFQLGTLILAFFATQEQIGIFAVASQVTARAMLVPDALATVLMPRVGTRCSVCPVGLVGLRSAPGGAGSVCQADRDRCLLA
ncbi:MAG: hypothetical protein ACYSPJ_02710 [Planctomycetota bacterium]|jgi:hypothetical protein